MVARLLDCNILVLVIGLFSGVFVNVLVNTNDGLNVPIACRARVRPRKRVQCKTWCTFHCRLPPFVASPSIVFCWVEVYEYNLGFYIFQILTQMKKIMMINILWELKDCQRKSMNIALVVEGATKIIKYPNFLLVLRLILLRN